MDNRLRESRTLWDTFSRLDPLWAILSFDSKTGRRWDLNDFMQSGEREAALLIHQLSRLGISLRPATAVDFGCGVGRVTQAFARRFHRALGIDVSRGMIDLAQILNKYPDQAFYRHNEVDHLEFIRSGTVDLVYSNIALQHIEPDIAAKYIAEFLRIARPGGVVVFQVPSERQSPQAPQIRPMPDDAYRCRVRMSDMPPVVEAGATVILSLEISNQSAHDWNQADVGSIQAGNHWLDGSGKRLVVQDDGRTPLPQTLPAGHRIAVELQVRAPLEPGRYTLELDVVHEGMTWFGDKGNHVLRRAVDVSPRRVNAGVDSGAVIAEEIVPHYDVSNLVTHLRTDDLAGAPQFPMYGLPRSAVVDLITIAGATLAHVDDDHRAAPEWIGYRYVVRV